MWYKHRYKKGWVHRYRLVTVICSGFKTKERKDLKMETNFRKEMLANNEACFEIVKRC